MSRNPDATSRSTDGEDGAAPWAPALRFSGVSLRYGREPETLRDISFALAAGSFHWLTGPSGAGKSSLLKLIYRAERPSRGLITLFGQDLESLPPSQLPLLRRRIGVVFQEFRLLEHLSAFDNVALPLRLAGKPSRAYRDDVAELLQWVGLGARLHAMPATLSGGEKQRLAIARAVITRPDILLADEPTGNVDPEMGQRLLRLLIELNRGGTTVLIASHDQELIAHSGLPALRLDRGRLRSGGEDIEEDASAMAPA
jgi:cell division transport system ATP-binding protein